MVSGGGPRTLADAAESYLTNCRRRRLSPQAIALISYVLCSLQDYLHSDNLEDLTTAELRKFLLHRMSEISASSAARYHTALSTFAKFLHEEGFLPENPTRSVSKPQFPQVVIKHLSQDQLEAMVTARGGSSFVDVRDRLV